MLRYAIYYTPPPFSALARFGAGILGYDCFEGIELAQARVNGIDPAMLKLMTVAPRRYGFHGTLVAPFRLDGASEDGLAGAVSAYATRTRPVHLGRLTVASLGSFVALVPAESRPEVSRLAADCLEAFAPFKAPLTAADRARRVKAGLTPRQVELMDRWGYPYVLDEFRFHMTLTGPLPDPDRDAIRSALADAFKNLAADEVEIDAISVMRQDDSAARFRVLERYRLRGS